MINYDLKKISTIILDVDGVLSKSTIGMSAEGLPLRTLNIKDGYAIQLAVKLGFKLIIVTGGTDDAIVKRYNYLGMTDIFMGCANKIDTYYNIRTRMDISDEEVIYIGDDIPDYEIMKLVGCPCCPADASTEIKDVSLYISPFNGGEGCVRDVIEQVLRAQGKWLNSSVAFGW